ncbi:MAG: HipA domain-containing protein [Gemmatimonadota bacterium]|nr:HipA domain-containing protein [Gemmatimonadota bacterium]
MTSDRECFVSIVLPGRTELVLAGRLRVSHTNEGMSLGRFVYGRSYLDRPDAVELDPVELRLSRSVYETARMDGIFGAIRDSMPDFWGRRLIELGTGQVVYQEVDYLLAGPDDRAGALAFATDTCLPEPRRAFHSIVDLARLHAIADRVSLDDVEGGGSPDRRLRGLDDCRTSMGGARPKAVVERGNRLWLAKFNRPDDRWNHPRVEHGLLRLARTCGLRSADSEVQRIGDREVLMVLRFDRQWNGTGYRRSRMVSGLTLLRADDTPMERWRWSYLALADELRRASARPAEDLLELFGRICFSIVVSNLDDYPRNHALVAPGSHWRLSPAYDLMPVPATGREQRNLAMICGPVGRTASRANALGAAHRFLLEHDEAVAVFDRIAETVRATWRSTMLECGVSRRDCDTISSAFVHTDPAE